MSGCVVCGCGYLFVWLRLRNNRLSAEVCGRSQMSEKAVKCEVEATGLARQPGLECEIVRFCGNIF